MEKAIYSERNSFFGGLTLLIPVGVELVLLALACYIVFFDPIVDSLEAMESTLVLAAVMVLVAVFGFVMRYTVAVYGDRVEVRFVRSRVIKIEDLSSCEAVDVHPIREFGGWGYRVTPRKRGYLVAGMRAVRFRSADGPDVYVCVRDPQALTAALQGRSRE